MNRTKRLYAMLLLALLAGSALVNEASAQDIIGTVVEAEADAALAECSIVCLADAHAFTPVTVFETKTDALGRFRVPTGTPPYQAIVVRKKDYGPDWLLINEPPREPPRIALHRAGSLKGLLLDDVGKPMSGLPVFAQPSGVERAIAQLLEARTTTNDAGEFQLDGLANKLYELQIQSPTHTLPEGRTVTVSAGETTGPSEFRAVRAYRVSGQAIDLKSGKPIAGAMVWASAAPGAERVKTDADGRYLLKRLAPGWHVLHVGAVDLNYVSVEEGAKENVGYPGTLQILVRDKNLEKMNVRLRQGCEISGMIVNKEKKPLKGFVVYLNNNEPQLSILVRRRRAVSDEQGRFIFRGVPVGEKYYCRVNQPGAESDKETVQFSTELFNLDLESSPKRLNITVDETIPVRKQRH